MQWSARRSALRYALDVRDGVPVVHVAGELDTSSTVEFTAAVAQARAVAAACLAVDLSRVTFCSVDGVRAIHRADADCRAVGVRMDLVNPHSAVRRVLDLAGILRHWGIEAVRSPTDAAIADSAHLAGVLRAAMSAVGALMGTAQYYEPVGETLQLVAHTGFRRPFVSFFETVEGNATSCGAAAGDLRAVYVDDVSSSPIFAGSPELDILIDAGVGSCVSLPITTTTHRLVGVVSAHRPVAGPWTEDQRDLLEHVRAYASELVKV